MAISDLVERTIKQIAPLDESAMDAARARQDQLTKPLGSLGRLEALSIQLAGIFGEPTPKISNKTVVLAAGDHGVVSEGVSAYPQDVTPAMVMNFLGGGAAINVLATHAGADIVVIDAGVAADLPSHPSLRSAKIGRGTANIAVGPAMSREQAIQCLEMGIQVCQEQIVSGTELFACGDMGIGNTTPSSAITSVVTGVGTDITTGRGTGLDDAGLAHKAEVVQRSIDVNKPDSKDGLDILMKVGGFEIGVLAGVFLGAAAGRRPVIVDGFISGAAALVAHAIAPEASYSFIASHQSVEPGHRLGLSHMGLEPLLDMGMRLGEGSGAVLSMHIVEAAAKCLSDMTTFAEAGVSEKIEDDAQGTTS